MTCAVVRHRRHLQLCCLQGHQISNDRLNPREPRASFLQQRAKHGGGRVQLPQKAQPAAPYLAPHRGNRKLCTICASVSLQPSPRCRFTALRVHLICTLRDAWRVPTATVATSEARLQERGSHILLDFGLHFAAAKKRPATARYASRVRSAQGSSGMRPSWFGLSVSAHATSQPRAALGPKTIPAGHRGGHRE